MNQVVRELKTLARELQKRDEELAIEVREGGRQTREGFERVMMAVHRMHNFVVILPQKLIKIANQLEE